MRRRLSWWATAVWLGACAHPAAMTAEEHRAHAAQNEQQATEERAAYDPNATSVAKVPASSAGDEALVMRLYNPTERHLAEADRQMTLAFEHLKAAQKLEKYENQMCSGISVAERTACPLLAPHVSGVQELPNGVALHLKPSANVITLGTQMRCHLAFAQSNGFDRAPCPLYLKGVQIDLIRDQRINVISADPMVATQVRREARRMFGEPLTQR